RDGESVLAFHIFKAMRSALDDLIHETLDVIHVRLGAGNQHLDNIVSLPITDAGFLVGSDIGNIYSQRARFGAGASKIEGAIGHADGISWRVTISAERHVLHQIFSSFDSTFWHLGRWRGEMAKRLQVNGYSQTADHRRPAF